MKARARRRRDRPPTDAERRAAIARVDWYTRLRERDPLAWLALVDPARWGPLPDEAGEDVRAEFRRRWPDVADRDR